MELLDYIRPLDKGARAELASRCKMSPGQLEHIAWRRRRANAAHAVLIERETDRVVRCETIRPDVDWQYIRSTAA